MVRRRKQQEYFEMPHYIVFILVKYTSNILIYYINIIYYLSPKLFSVYVDELSKTLSTAKNGCIINVISINHVFYAGDLCIISASPSGLQTLIDICFEYSLHKDEI